MRTLALRSTDSSSRCLTFVLRPLRGSTLTRANTSMGFQRSEGLHGVLLSRVATLLPHFCRNPEAVEVRPA